MADVCYMYTIIVQCITFCVHGVHVHVYGYRYRTVRCVHVGVRECVQAPVCVVSMARSQFVLFIALGHDLIVLYYRCHCINSQIAK